VNARLLPLPGAERTREAQAPPARVPSLLVAGVESMGAIVLVMDDALQVLHANRRGRDAGVAPGQPLADAMAKLRAHVASLGGGEEAASDWSLSIKGVDLPDFRGFVASMRLRARSEASEDAVERLLLQNVQLQERLVSQEMSQRQAFSAADAQKRQFAVELHDGLGQFLTGVAFLARSLSETIAAGQEPKSADAGLLVQLLNEAVARTRATAHGLWPITYERMSLSDALEQLAADIERLHGIRCEVQASDEPAGIGPEVLHEIIRIVQEAVSNAIRHAHARQITVRLESLGSDFVISIANDGLPWDVERAGSSGGIGLVGMRLRAQSIDAELSIDRLESGGSEVTLLLRGASHAAPLPVRKETDS
jgi:signal transduction histidine kinase